MFQNNHIDQWSSHWPWIFQYQEDRPLLFTQFYFWIFLCLVLLFYGLFYKRKTGRSIYLFIISLFFYYKSGGYFFSLLIISILTDYIAGYQVYRSKQKSTRRFYLIASLCVNLGLLAYFKYAYFIADTFQTLTGHPMEVTNLLAIWTNRLTGSHFNVDAIVLPVGISFYTFQSISYTVDVYRGKIKPVSNFFDFAFYVSFFPQLVAGPIVRAAHFLPQVYAKYKLTIQQMGHALFLIMNGLIKKVLISDTIAIHFVDRVFDAPMAHTGFQNLMALYGYSLQIYCDFSGYTDMAIGVALLFGFRLPINFNSPYKAMNLTDFWRRWHISLSSWLRDYLYISLGGNRKGRFRMGFNIMATMLLGGLWHGANLKFIIWGGLHGLGLLIQKGLQSIFSQHKKSNGFRKFVSIFITFHVVTLLWLIFRADSLRSATIMFKQVLFDFNFNLVPEIVYAYRYVLVLIVIGYLIHWLPSRLKEWYRGVYIKWPIIIKAILFILLFFVLYQVKSTEFQPFIYFRF